MRSSAASDIIGSILSSQEECDELVLGACPKIRKIGPTSGPGPGGRPEHVEGDDFRASIGGIQGRSKAA